MVMNAERPETHQGACPPAENISFELFIRPAKTIPAPIIPRIYRIMTI
jgi:hypothetical protein